jgi:hypothetical protein
MAKKKDKEADEQDVAAAAAAEEEPSGISIAGSPRATGSVRRMKSWGGLIGFGLVYVVSWRQGMPMPDAALRALIGGIVGSTAAWAAGVTIWRHILRAQAVAAARKVQDGKREAAA